MRARIFEYVFRCHHVPTVLSLLIATLCTTLISKCVICISVTPTPIVIYLSLRVQVLAVDIERARGAPAWAQLLEGENDPLQAKVSFIFLDSVTTAFVLLHTITMALRYYFCRSCFQTLRQVLSYILSQWHSFSLRGTR